MRSHLDGCLSDGVGCVVQENPGTSNTSKPSGLGVGTGARDSTESFVNWSVWMPIVPSKYAVASSSRFRGHQETWNALMSVVGSYNNIRNDVD